MSRYCDRTTARQELSNILMSDWPEGMKKINVFYKAKDDIPIGNRDGKGISDSDYLMTKHRAMTTVPCQFL